MTTMAPTSITMRSISSTVRLEKGPVDAAKDTLKQADRVVSDAAIKGIDLGSMFRPPQNSQIAPAEPCTAQIDC